MVEDEKHVLLKCENYTSERRSMFNELNDIFPAFPHQNIDEQLKFIMSCDDRDLFDELLIFLQSVVQKRGEL